MLRSLRAAKHVTETGIKHEPAPKVSEWAEAAQPNVFTGMQDDSRRPGGKILGAWLTSL